MRRYTRILLSLSSAILLVEGVIRYHYIIWIAFVPLLLAIHKETFIYRIIYGAIWAIFISFYLFYPVLNYGVKFLIAFFIYCGSLGAILTWLAEYLRQNRAKAIGMLTFPALWVALEFLRTLGPISFPMSLASTFYRNLPFIQLTSITGVYGISFLITLVNVIIFEWVTFFYERKSAKTLIAATVIMALILSANMFWGRSIFLQREVKKGKTVKIAVIQGSIPTWMYRHEKNKFYKKTIEETYFRMSEQANKDYRPELVIWPENAINRWALEAQDLKRKLFDMAKKYGNSMIVGALHLDEAGNSYNTAFIINESGKSIDRYEKIRLLPLAETFFSGRNQKVFDMPFGKIGILICFESMYPQMSRAAIKKGAETLFILTNDAGFKNTHLAGLHARETIFRAIENRCTVIRAAQSGISMVVDKYGRTIKSTDLFDPTIMYSDVYLTEETGSPYNRVGDIFVYICLIFLLTYAILVKEIYQSL